MLGIGAMMQSSGQLYDLGEAMKPVEDFTGGAVKAGGAVVDAIGKGFEMPAWLLAFALVVAALRFVMFAPTADKIVQGRNDRAAHREAMELTRLQHEQQLERIRTENGEKP